MDTAALTQAVDLALKEEWDAAHHIVQDFEDEFACWIHAVLHKIEGDEGNSRYWYRRAGREFTTSLSPEGELMLIRKSLQEFPQ